MNKNLNRRIHLIAEAYGLSPKNLVTISEEDALDGKEGCGGSFELDANAAIRYAINLKKNI